MIYFLGGGNMASAIVSGLCRANRTNEIFVANRGAEKREALTQKFGIKTAAQLPELSANDVLILAVKPQDMQAACADVHTNGALVISLAAGLTIDTLSRYLHGATRIIRSMPNTPAQVGLGITGVFAPDTLSGSDKNTAEQILATCGAVIWLDDEAKMHAITAVSGSGSAYVFYLLAALQQAAQNLGFDADAAKKLSLQTFQGALELAAQSGEEFGVLQDKVTSKGGTTFAALETFRQHQIAENLAWGVAAAAHRSEELAQQFSIA